MTGRKTTKKDERNVYNNKRVGRDTWMTQSSKEKRTHTADRTTTLIKKVNNECDECIVVEIKWQKVSGGADKGNWWAAEGNI